LPSRPSTALPPPKWKGPDRRSLTPAPPASARRRPPAPEPPAPGRSPKWPSARDPPVRAAPKHIVSGRRPIRAAPKRNVSGRPPLRGVPKHIASGRAGRASRIRRSVRRDRVDSSRRSRNPDETRRSPPCAPPPRRAASRWAHASPAGPKVAGADKPSACPPPEGRGRFERPRSPFAGGRSSRRTARAVEMAPRASSPSGV